MSAFLSDLDIRWALFDTSVDKRGTRKLLAPLVYQSDHLGMRITVPAGFITDFASVPRVPVAYLLTGGTAQQAAVIHDFLYSAKIVSRRDADAVFYEACRLDEPLWRSWIMWLAVRVGGRGPFFRAPNQIQPPEVIAEVPNLA